MPVDEVLLTPGNRADLLVTAATGTAVLQALPYRRGSAMGMGMGGETPSAATGSVVDLMTLTVAGAPVPAPPATI